MSGDFVDESSWADQIGRCPPFLRAPLRNTCVQSRSDRRWYQCQDGGWVDRAPDPERCASVHPL